VITAKPYLPGLMGLDSAAVEVFLPITPGNHPAVVCLGAPARVRTDSSEVVTSPLSAMISADRGVPIGLESIFEPVRVIPIANFTARAGEHAESARREPLPNTAPNVSTETDCATNVIGERARRRRKFLDPILIDKGMTVNGWADAVEGLSHSTVFRYYNGETVPRTDTLQKLAKPLELTVKDLHSL